MSDLCTLSCWWRLAQWQGKPVQLNVRASQTSMAGSRAAQGAAQTFSDSKLGKPLPVVLAFTRIALCAAYTCSGGSSSTLLGSGLVSLGSFRQQPGTVAPRPASARCCAQPPCACAPHHHSASIRTSQLAPATLSPFFSALVLGSEAEMTSWWAAALPTVRPNPRGQE